LSGCFLDTTVVINIADVLSTDRSKCESFIAGNQPAEMPYYALRELLVGRVQILCDAHNALKASSNHAEALLALLNRSPAEGRKKEARVKDVAYALKRVFDANPTGDRESLKRELLEDLALKAARLWRNARNLKMVVKVQPLACFNDGKLAYGNTGELRGPVDSFNCLKSERCAAAAYIYDDASILKRLIDALHPSNLDLKVASKGETRSRRKALKELQSSGPVKFNKRLCRAIGDAYFAAMCPAGSVVVSSNMEDFSPLCSALGKEAKEP